ncbi:MAG: hypothetical protein ACYTDY_06485 [Planctomycetota bacterium]|jgi:hypothetical protein
MHANAFRLLLTPLLVLAIAGTALGQGTEIFSGQSTKASLDAPGMWHAYRLEVVEGDAMKLKIVASKKTDLSLDVRLHGPTSEIPLPDPVKGKIKAKIELPSTGLYFLLVAGEYPTIGDYKMKLKLKRAKFQTAEFAVPGEVVFDAPHGSLVSAKIQAVKGATLEPGVDGVTNVMGDDVLDANALTEKGSTAKLKKLPLPQFGEHRIVLAVRGGEPAKATVKLKMKPPKPPEKKIGQRSAIHTMFAKIQEAGVMRFGHVLAEVVALDTTAASLKFPPGTGKADLPLTGTIGNAQTPGEFVHEENFDTEGEMDAAFPDGFYTLVLTRGDGTTSEFPILVRGTYPSDISVTDFGAVPTPTITWTGGGDSQMFVVDVRDIALDTAVLVTVLPRSATSHVVPPGVIEAGKEYLIEIRGMGVGSKTVLTREQHQY